jgi:hypothetical protein
MMILHKFNIGDVEDPCLYVDFSISEWLQTEKGKWIMENAIKPPVYHIDPSMSHMGHQVWIEGTLTPEAETYFRLKYE